MTIQTKMINGKPHVRVKDLIPNPKNKEIYDQNAVRQIADSFERRKKSGLTPNMQPVTYWPNKMLDQGHTRTESAIYNGYEWIWAIPSDSPVPDGSAPYDEIMHTIDGNRQRKKNWSVLLGEWQAAKDGYRAQYTLDMPSSEENQLIQDMQTTKKTLQRVAEIKIKMPELMEAIDNGGGVEYNWKLATGQLNRKILPAKKNGMDLSALFKDVRVRSKIITTAVKYIKDFRDLKMEFDDFTLCPFEHDECGRWESGAGTTMASHAFMSSMAGKLKEMGYNVRTATGHPMDPDIRIIDEDEKIEVKCTQFAGHGSLTKWSGGRDCRPGKYLLVSHDLNFENIFVAFTDLDDDDWGGADSNNKRKLHLNIWYNNRKDTAEIWKGKIDLVKTNKIKEGQVQMRLAPIHDPI